MSDFDDLLVPDDEPERPRRAQAMLYATQVAAHSLELRLTELRMRELQQFGFETAVEFIEEGKEATPQYESSDMQEVRLAMVNYWNNLIALSRSLPPDEATLQKFRELCASEGYDCPKSLTHL